MAEIQIGEIRKHTFKKGDVLVIKAPFSLNDKEYRSIVDKCAKILPEGVSLLILDNGKDIAVIEKEEK
jgi:hypothetical protein